MSDIRRFDQYDSIWVDQLFVALTSLDWGNYPKMPEPFRLVIAIICSD